jgi:very-short-patch-repair endonuclease
MSSISKETYVTRNFQKISNKRWELYVITRVIHLLNDPDIEYVCQQYINPPMNKDYYLADLAFPTLALFLEVDEGQHDAEHHILSDIKREKEILEATDWECKRIAVYTKKGLIKVDKKLEDIDFEIDKFVEEIKHKKQLLLKGGHQITWKYGEKYKPETYLKKGIIDVSENVTLLNHRDVLNLFGYNKGHYQRAFWRIKGFDEAVWFPKLYDNKDWVNSFDDKTGTICQYRKDLQTLALPSEEDRLVFAHNKNILGQTVYKFCGVFSTDRSRTNKLKHYFIRKETRVDLNKYQG